MRSLLPEHARLSRRLSILWMAAIAAVLFCAPGYALAASPHVRPTVSGFSCAACHSTHGADDLILTKTKGGAADVTGSCLTCHDGSDPTASNVTGGVVDSFGSTSGHSMAKAATGSVRIAGCDTCHEVHGVSADGRGIPAHVIAGVTVTGAGNDICLACHASSETWFGPGYPSTAEPMRDATGFPISGTWPGPETYGSPSDAHSLIPESTQTVGVNDPLRRQQGDCLYCHAAHGAANAYDSLVGTYTVPSRSTLASDRADGSYASLCFSCHGGVKPSGFATAPADIKQFAMASTDASDTGGHSIITSGGTLPVGAPLPCFECHNPHGSQRGNAGLVSDERGASLATTSAAGVRAFCFTCHTASDTGSGWDSTTATYGPVSSAIAVVGLSRQGGLLRLPVQDGHAESDSASCYQCHGDDYGVGGHNVHDPGDGHVPVSDAATDATASAGETTTGATDTSLTIGGATTTFDSAATMDAAAAIEATASVSVTATVEDTGSAVPTSTAVTPASTADPGVSDRSGVADSPMWPGLSPPVAGPGPPLVAARAGPVGAGTPRAGPSEPDDGVVIA